MYLPYLSARSSYNVPVPHHKLELQKHGFLFGFLFGTAAQMHQQYQPISAQAPSSNIKQTSSSPIS
jgi:hypothetical protein